MEIYVLDSLLRRIACVDEFESFIWTERFSSKGDFELKLSSTYGHRNLFTAGTRLVQNGSTRVMTVETIQDDTDEEDREILTVKGPSIEDILEHRVAFDNNVSLTTDPGWNLTGTAGDICRAIFNYVCRTGSLNSLDTIPFLMSGSIYPTDTIAESLTDLNITLTPGSVYDAIKSLCDANELGFRLVRPYSGGQLYFDIYAGLDVTTRQSDNPPVIFSAGMDDLQKTTELTVVEGSKNVAYVYSAVGFEMVFGEHVPVDIDGFSRRILFVDGSSVTADNPDISGALQQLGTDALMANRASTYFDGEISQHTQYRYDIDYRLGDLVELRNRDGKRTYKRVTEQIFVDDENGERSYPTLSADLFVGTEDWIHYDRDSKVWSDFTYPVWEDLP